MTRTEMIRRRRLMHRRIREAVTERRMALALRPLAHPPPDEEPDSATLP